jgi:hypothetical protein
MEKTKYKGQISVKYGANDYFLDCSLAIKYNNSDPNMNILVQNITNQNNKSLTIDSPQITQNSFNKSEINPLSPIPATKIEGDPSLSFKKPNISSDYYGVGESNCGIKNPKEQSECNIFSTNKYSCCYYNELNITGCYWVGRKLKGEYLGAIKLTCNSSIHFPAIFLLVIIFLFYLF